MGSNSGVEVSAWVKIGDGTDIQYHVFDDGEVEFSIGGRDGFDLITTGHGLHNFLVHGEEALRVARRAVADAEQDCATP